MKSIVILRLWVATLAAAWVVSGCAAKQTQVDTPVSQLETPHYFTLGGERLLKGGDSQGAAGLFQKALAMNQSYVPAMVGMARAESSLGNSKMAFEWGEKALDSADTRQDRLLANTVLMEINLEFKPEDWLDSMESIWQEIRAENPKPEGPALLMGKGYQADGQYLKAVVCYRQVIDWGGDHVGEADRLMGTLYQQLRAEPGSQAGPALAPMDRVSRGDLSALLIEDLRLPEYVKAQESPKYAARFQPPGASSGEEGEEAIPTDVSGHPFAVDIQEVLKYHIRGLEPFPDGLFYPDQPLSRANFALVVEDVLVRVKNEPLLKSAFVGNTSPFTDVSNEHYAFNAMIVGTTRNFLAADLNGSFRPDAPVTGAEALLALRRLKEEIRGRQVKY